VLKEYKEMIAETQSDLEERLEAINAKLKSLSSQKNEASGEELNERNRIQEERDSTTQCIDICAQVSTHIDQVRPNVLRNISIPPGASQGPITTLDGLISARFATDDALSKCKTTLKDMRIRLEERLHNLDAHLQTLQPERGATSEEQDAERQRIQDEYDTTKQSLSICSEASERATESRINLFEDVSMAEDGNQVIVSTIGDLISAKRINAGARSTQWLGQMSDESLQELTHAVTYVSLAKTGDRPEEVKAFEARYGAGFKLKANDSATGGAKAYPGGLGG
jgi:DNA repair exonuclease SbcCD ATPase subunit